LLSALLPERILKRRIGHRESLPFDEIYRTDFQRFPYSRNLIENAWNELASDFALDARKLRPADRSEFALSVEGFPLDDLSEAANARLKKRLREVKASSSDAKKYSQSTRFVTMSSSCALLNVSAHRDMKVATRSHQ